MSYEELETVLEEIETVINCRPLTYLFEDTEQALTLSHLVIGRRLISNIGTNVVDSTEHTPEILNSRYRYLQSLIDHYWKRFQSEYLLDLHQHHINVFKGNYDEFSRLVLGDVVLIKDDVSKSNIWKKGKVEKLIMGRGALLEVCHAGRVSFLERPVQKDIPLEVAKNNLIENNVSSVVDSGDAALDKSLLVAESHDVSSKGRIRMNPNRYQSIW